MTTPDVDSFRIDYGSSISEKMYDSNGNIVEETCSCGRPAVTSMLGCRSHVWLCSMCAYGEDEPFSLPMGYVE